MKLRLFIGIACPLLPGVASVLQALGEASQEAGSGVRVVKPANLHITLKFLGTCSAEQVTHIEQALAATASKHGAFDINLQGAGCVHGALWLGVQPSPSLYDLEATLREHLLALGFTADAKPYQPHLTVARLNHNPGFAWRAWQQQLQTSAFGSFAVNAIHLYQSETLATGAHYTVLHSAALHSL